MADYNTRLHTLETFFHSFVKRTDMERFYDKAEAHSTQQSVSKATEGVSDNDVAICDVADLADTNSTAIDDIGIILDDLIHRVEELEKEKQQQIDEIQEEDK